MWPSSNRLRLFRADLQEEGSFDDAVKGCDGVFHVAASMKFSVLANEDIGNSMRINYQAIQKFSVNNLTLWFFSEFEETYVQKNFIYPAIKGTLNLLKACLKSKSVKRVVFTSSISTITAKDSSGNWRPVVDESCQTHVDHVCKTKANGWVMFPLPLLLLTLLCM